MAPRKTNTKLGKSLVRFDGSYLSYLSCSDYTCQWLGHLLEFSKSSRWHQLQVLMRSDGMAAIRHHTTFEASSYGNWQPCARSSYHAADKERILCQKPLTNQVAKANFTNGPHRQNQAPPVAETDGCHTMHTLNNTSVCFWTYRPLQDYVAIVSPLESEVTVRRSVKCVKCCRQASNAAVGNLTARRLATPSNDFMFCACRPTLSWHPSPCLCIFWQKCVPKHSQTKELKNRYCSLLFARSHWTVQTQIPEGIAFHKCFHKRFRFISIVSSLCNVQIQNVMVDLTALAWTPWDVADFPPPRRHSGALGPDKQHSSRYPSKIFLVSRSRLSQAFQTSLDQMLCAELMMMTMVVV